MLARLQLYCAMCMPSGSTCVSCGLALEKDNEPCWQHNAFAQKHIQAMPVQCLGCQTSSTPLTHAYMHARMHARTHACTHVWMHTCMDAGTFGDLVEHWNSFCSDPPSELDSVKQLHDDIRMLRDRVASDRVASRKRRDMTAVLESKRHKSDGPSAARPSTAARSNTAAAASSAPCHVCGQDDSADGDILLSCAKCSCRVHQTCYGVGNPTSRWLCDCCKSGDARQVKCMLCKRKGGGLKPSHDGSGWCHVACVLWLAETGFVDHKHMDKVEGVQAALKSHARLTCVVCKAAGAPVQCSQPNCSLAAHPTCARDANWGLDMWAMKATCRQHTPRKPKPEAAISTASLQSMR